MRTRSPRHSSPELPAELAATTALSSTLAASFVILANAKGGVGKTTLATLIADLWTMTGQIYRAFQVDDQRRLEAMLGAQVGTIVPDFEAAMRQPRALTGPFAPVYTALSEAAGTGHRVLLEAGANRVELTALWTRKTELQEDLTAWGVRPVVMVPATVEAEALRQAAVALRTFGEALPEASLVFVENQRDGRLTDLKPRSEAALVWREALAPLLSEAGRHHLVMPLIEADAWSAYEDHGLRFIKAMSMAPSEAARLLGEDVSEAKIMRSAVTAFVRAMRVELTRVLPELATRESE
jgi:hypothetical protein